MAKKMKCSCGSMAEVRTSQGKHKVPYLVCPQCGPIMGRKRTYIERIHREAVEVAESENKQVQGAEKPDSKAESGAGQQSDSGVQTPPRKSLLSGWGTVL